MHVCRGNWTRDESAALAGDYAAIGSASLIDPGRHAVPGAVHVRAGSPEVLLDLPRNVRVGVGVADQKSPRVETPEEIGSRAERAISWFGPERVLLNPACGFATFADSPITSFEIARAKLANLVQASLILRERYA